MLRLKQSIRFTSVVLVTFFLSAIPKFPVYAGQASDECSPHYATSNQTCTGTVADGLKVHSVTGHFNYDNKICYWHYQVAFYNKKDPQSYDPPVTTATGPVSKGCDTEGSWAKGWDPYFKSNNGAVCARLYKRSSPTGGDVEVDNIGACANLPL